MNIQPGMLQQLPAELRSALLAILGQGPQEVEQNQFPPVNGEVFASRSKIKKAQDGGFFATDGRQIANNPVQHPGYKPTLWPRMLYKISEFEFETTMVDPKTTEDKHVTKRVRTKDAAEELRAAGWTPKLITKVVLDQAALNVEKKRGWLETPESFHAIVLAYPEE